MSPERVARGEFIRELSPSDIAFRLRASPIGNRNVSFFSADFREFAAAAVRGNRWKAAVITRGFGVGQVCSIRACWSVSLSGTVVLHNYSFEYRVFVFSDLRGLLGILNSVAQSHLALATVLRICVFKQLFFYIITPFRKGYFCISAVLSTETCVLATLSSLPF